MAEANFDKVGVVVGLPFTDRPVAPEWGIGLATQTYPLNTAVSLCPCKNVKIDEAREQIAEIALKHKAKYLWFVDSDTILPPHAIQRLGYALDQQAPPLGTAAAITGVVCTKTEPAMPVIFKEEGDGPYWNWKLNTVFDIKRTGCACMLIRTEVLEKIPRPWFKFTEKYVKQPDGSVTTERVSEDTYFCRKLTEAGYTILAHGGVLCGHYDVDTGKIFTLPEDSYPVKAAREDEANTVTVPLV